MVDRDEINATLIQAAGLLEQAATLALANGAEEIDMDGFTLTPGDKPALSIAVTWPEEKEEDVDELLA